VWNGDALYVSEIGTAVNGMPPPARMLKVTTDGTVSVAIADSGSNGLAVDIHNTIYGAVHEDGSISTFNLATMARTPVATGYMGARFDSPNDLAVRSDGNVYFSDPDDQAPATKPQLQTRLYRVAAGTNAVSVIDATLAEPNGVTLSLDESMLFVTTNNGIWKYPVMSDGSVGTGSLLNATLNTFSGDGMAIDCAGDLYIAAQNSTNVMVVSPAGTLIGMISLPTSAFQAVTNVAFGGADHKTLYITGLGNNKGLYQVPMSLPGMPY
jgi:gluconolactonase